MRHSSVYLSADGRTAYVNDQNGTRRRVVVLDDGTVIFQRRYGKAARKAAKRVMSRARARRQAEAAS